MPFQACSPGDTTCTGRSNGGNRIINRPAITATKVTPFRKKHIVTPTAPIIKPAIDGPTTRAPFTIELLSEIAFSKSSRLVISTVNAWRAGMSNPIEIPFNAATIMMNGVVAKPNHTPAATKNAQIIWAACVATRIERFGYRSASAPPQMDEIIIGADPTADTTPSRSFEFVIWYTYQLIAVCCIHVPM